ncbi:MAG: hypothetical protein Q9192_004264 [Flavoplaca navasiana]
MYPSFQIIPALLFFSQCMLQSWALPATPVAGNADQELGMSLGSGPRIPGRLGTRPQNNLLWPESRSGDFHVRFSHYKDLVNYDDGIAVIQKALDDIDGWMKITKKGGWIPVEHEHFWQHGKARITTKPDGSGFLMTDLQKYMNIISTMHKHYDEYFEYRADLLKTKRFGIVVKVGSCTMMNDPL